MVARSVRDAEVAGSNPAVQDKIITIQFQQLEDGEPLGDFTVLAEWEWGEKEILRNVQEKGLLDPGWDFVPVGNRLRFDLNFVVERCERLKLIAWKPGEVKYYFFEKPMLDLASVLVLMNRGRFEGSSLTAFTSKEQWGNVIRTHYHNGEFAEILEYVEKEKEAFLELYREVRSVLSTLGDRRKQHLAE